MTDVADGFDGQIEIVRRTRGYALTSGQGAKVGQLFGVATNDAALSADVALDARAETVRG